jgi:polyhydroxybutyrate depolymerase
MFGSQEHRRRTVCAWCVLLGWLLALIWLPTAARAGEDRTLTLQVGDQARVAYLHLPAKLDVSRKYPFVIGLHGGAGNAEGYIAQSRLFEKGELAGFIVVCPQGTSIFQIGNHRVWNSGAEYMRSSRAADDVSFVRALIGKISAAFPVDEKRIFATGFSNGGQMAYRLALELSDKIAAIAPMSGGRVAEGSRPSRPVPVLHIHGTADDYYPLEGGRGSRSLGRVPHVPIVAVVAEWTSFNGGAAAATFAPHKGWEMQAHDGPAPVTLVVVKGLGHQIAGGLDNGLPRQAMRSEPDGISLALQFFAAHPMR